jgi:UDP-N-acetylmuramoylalanine--D-glutamate ligase
VARRGKVLFINDSKATNADAAEKALASFDRIYWIAGGRPKEGGITTLGDYFPKIAKAYLIGEAATDFANTLGARVPHDIAVTLPLAVASAARDAANDGAGEPVVLLSPACASYDQFQNFERRGDAFRALVLSLDGITRRGEAA